MKYWSSGRPGEVQPAEVEMTAYALMSHLANGGSSAIGSALPIVRWLTSQRNARGGFRSTQVGSIGKKGFWVLGSW